MFSDKIRELMIERDISLTDLAELSGGPFETLRNIYYRKVKDLKVSTAFQLASALEVTVEYLLKDICSNFRSLSDLGLCWVEPTESSLEEKYDDLLDCGIRQQNVYHGSTCRT